MDPARRERHGARVVRRPRAGDHRRRRRDAPRQRTGGLALGALAASLRSREGPVLAGVCWRLGTRFDIDLVILRVAFAVAALAGGGGIVAYAVLAIVLRPEALGGGGAVGLRPGRRTWMIVGGVGLLTLSLMLALRALGLWWSDAVAWPVVLAVCGLVLLWRQSERPEAVRNPRTLLGAGLIVGGGVVFLSET